MVLLELPGMPAVLLSSLANLSGKSKRINCLAGLRNLGSGMSGQG